MSEDILYSFRRCPFAIRARWAIIKTGQTVRLREVSLQKKPKQLLDISSKGTVPVLITNKKEIIEESLGIMEWALKTSDPQDILRRNNKKENEEINSLLDTNDGIFKFHLDRFKYASRYPKEDSEYHKKSARKILSKLNARLELSSSSNNNWLLQTGESLADWGIWPFVRQYWLADPNWIDGNPKMAPLRNWLNFYVKSPLFDTLMTKQKPWTSKDHPVNFPSGASNNFKEKNIYHLALRKDFENAKKHGVYTMSTLGKKICEVGYIHASFYSQIENIYNLFFKDQEDVVLIKMNINKLRSPVRLEGNQEDNLYPHIYGSLLLDEILEVKQYPYL